MCREAVLQECREQSEHEEQAGNSQYKRHTYGSLVSQVPGNDTRHAEM